MKKNTLLSLLAIGALAAQAAGAETPNQRIVNGDRATAGNYPWFVTVNAGDGQCGGSIVHPNWVLTAAHCFTANQSPSTVSVVAGRDLLSNTSSGAQITAARIVRHAEYNDTTKDNDVALIELAAPLSQATVRLASTAKMAATGATTRAVGRGGLASPVNYLVSQLSLTASGCSTDVTPCLTEAQQRGQTPTQIVQTMLLANGLGQATSGVGYSQLAAALVQLGGTSADTATVDGLVTGLLARGNTLKQIADTIANAAAGSDEVREIDLPLVDINTCQGEYGGGLTANMFCAGYKGTPRDTCQGDSGGPLVVRNARGNDWIQVGVVSFGLACATNYGVYAKVPNYLDWVSQYVPNYDAERLFLWAEDSVASLLQPVGNERSASYAPYWARIYAASGKAVGVNTSDNKVYYYDGSQLQPVGDLSSFMPTVRGAGY